MRYAIGAIIVAWAILIAFFIGSDYGDHKAMNRYLDHQDAKGRMAE